jgi:hypothetical protein
MHSRHDQEPPPHWWAALEAALVTMFPGATWNRAKMAELRPYFVAEWRQGQKPKSAARTVCSCDGKTIHLNESIRVVPARPPKGAKRGEVFGADELRPIAPIERIDRKIEKVIAEIRTLESKATADAGKRPRKADAEKAEERRQRIEVRKRELDELRKERRQAVAESTEPKPRVSRPRAKRPASPSAPSCPPGVASCKLGLVGQACGLPAPLVLASAMGSPIERAARYCLTSAWKVTPSHNPLRGFSPNPEYPAGVQERAYDREKGEQLKVLGIAQNMIPALIFNGAPGAIDGLPVVTSTGIVLGGNGRTQALQLHYAQGGRAARDYLRDNAAQFGFTRAQIAAVPDPIVVRVVETPEPGAPDYQKTLRELVRLLNVPLLQSLGVREESVAEAARLTDEALDVLALALGDDLSLAEYLSSRQSRAFADALRRAAILTDRNAVRLLEKDGDSFSDDGKTFVERLLTGALINDAGLLEQAGPQLRGTLARGAPWLLSAAAAGQDWDLRGAMRAAVVDLVDMRRRDVPSVDAYLRQTTLGESPAVLGVELGREVLQVLSALAGRPVLFGRFARQYAELSRRHPSAQFSLIPEEKLSPAQALRQAAAAVGVNL